MWTIVTLLLCLTGSGARAEEGFCRDNSCNDVTLGKCLHFIHPMMHVLSNARPEESFQSIVGCKFVW